MRGVSKYWDDPREQFILAAVISLILLLVIAVTDIISIDEFNNWMSLFAFVSIIMVTFAATRKRRG